MPHTPQQQSSATAEINASPPSSLDFEGFDDLFQLRRGGPNMLQASHHLRGHSCEMEDIVSMTAFFKQWLN